MPYKELAWAVGFLALLLSLYVGSYYALVTQEKAFYPARNRAKALHELMDIEESYCYLEPKITPKYRIGGDVAMHIFSTWHNIDRNIRTEYWHPKWRLYASPKRSF